MAGTAIGDEPPARHVLSEFAFDPVLVVSIQRGLVISRSGQMTHRLITVFAPIRPHQAVGRAFERLCERTSVLGPRGIFHDPTPFRFPLSRPSESVARILSPTHDLSAAWCGFCTALHHLCLRRAPMGPDEIR